jgi:hypothetical protein
MIAGRQFSLRSLLIATAFLAASCAAGRYFLTTDRGGSAAGSRAIAFLSIPLALCGAFGVVRGRLWKWLVIGVAIDVAIIALMLAS